MADPKLGIPLVVSPLLIDRVYVPRLFAWLDIETSNDSRYSAHEPALWIRGTNLMSHTRKTGRIRSITAGDKLSAAIVENDVVLST
jgi:hypothetical protein